MNLTKEKILVFLLVGCLFTGIGAAAKVNVDIDVDVPGTITVGEDFDVEIALTNDDNDENVEADDRIDIKIWIDNVLVHEEDNYELGFDLPPDNSTTITISSKEFEVDNDNIWEENLLNYACDEDIEVKAEVSGDVDKATADDEFDVEPEDEDYELSIDISPEAPGVDDEITIKVEDEDGDELDDAYVKVTRLEEDEEWDADDKYWDDRTDNDGEVTLTLDEEREFRGDPYSKYQIDVWVRDEYCKITEYFDSRRRLDIKDIPAQAFVGKSIKIRVVDDKDKAVSGATLALSKEGFHQVFKPTDSGGYISFDLEEAGTYSMVASKSGYSESNIYQLEVGVRGTVSFSIQPENPVVGSDVKIVVTNADGALLPGAKVVITRPDGSKEPVKVTPDTGQISYTPLAPGGYKVRVEEASHKPAEKTFSAFNEFTITLPKIELFKRLPVVVMDQDGSLVGGATVAISGTTVAGTTDKEGKFYFELEEPGDYTITVKKSGFRDKSEGLSTKGELFLQLSSTKVDMQEEITFSVVDSQGEVIEGVTLEISRPDGGKEAASGNSYLPSMPGEYKVTAIKENYQTATASFTVKGLPLELDIRPGGGRLTVTATSKGEPVADLTIVVETIFGGEELSTDERGRVEVEFENIEESLEVTVKVEDARYEKRSEVTTVNPPTLIPWEWVLGLILIILILVAIYVGRKRKGSKEKGREATFVKGKSSLRG